MNFGDLKASCCGKDIVLCGSGPSLDRYSLHPRAGIHIALNKAFMKENLNFKAMICADYTAIAGAKEELAQRVDLIKILGRIPGPGESTIPEDFFELENVISFNISDHLDSLSADGSFTCNIEQEPLRFYRSIATTAVQIALYCCPQRLYLVGLDFSNAGHFVGSCDTPEMSQKHSQWARTHWEVNDIRKLWADVAAFAWENYPQTQIFSINPVSLKGIFSDIYS